jgi:phosphoglycolate phosphatase
MLDKTASPSNDTAKVASGCEEPRVLQSDPSVASKTSDLATQGEAQSERSRAKTGNVRTIIYDWNGTLLDDVAIGLDALNISLVGCGYRPISLQDLRQHYDVPMRNMYIGLGVPAELIETNYKNLTDPFVEAYLRLGKGARLRPESAALLKEANDNGVRQHILSNHLTSAIWNDMKERSIDRFFTTVIANDHLDFGKKALTKGDKLGLYMKNNKLSPDDMVIIGDTPEEMRIARNLGLRSVAVCGGYASRERLQAEKPDQLIGELDELRPVLREWGFL